MTRSTLRNSTVKRKIYIVGKNKYGIDDEVIEEYYLKRFDCNNLGVITRTVWEKKKDFIVPYTLINNAKLAAAKVAEIIRTNNDPIAFGAGGGEICLENFSEGLYFQIESENRIQLDEIEIYGEEEIMSFSSVKELFLSEMHNSVHTSPGIKDIENVSREETYWPEKQRDLLISLCENIFNDLASKLRKD